MTGINHLKLERKYRRDSGKKKGVVIYRVKKKKSRGKKADKKNGKRVMSPP